MTLVVYVGGDCLQVGNQMLREYEKGRIRNINGLMPYAPQDDKEINDKTNQTEESNNGLAEKIFNKDTKAMIDADILIFDVANTSVGTVAEIGQWAMIHYLSKQFPHDIFLRKLASKPIFFHSSDVRDTYIPEVGYRRSHGYNQYVVGACYECNSKGIQTWEEIMDELKDLVDKYE